MTEWAFLLTPLLLLPIVFLFRFVGCTPFGATDPEPAPPLPLSYRDEILKTEGLIAYWRLVDIQSPNVPTRGQSAADELKKKPGSYQLADGKNWNSPGKDLIGADPGQPLFFDGGYVLVPFSPNLFTEEFTIEAWFSLGASPNSRTLFSAGGRYVAPGANPPAIFHGFSLTANVTHLWEARFGPNGLDALEGTKPMVPLPGATTHVTLTVGPRAAGTLPVKLYHNGGLIGHGDLSSYSLAIDSPLLIGIDAVDVTSGDPAPNPSPRPDVNTSMNGFIQEVALYKRALTLSEITARFKLFKA